MCIRRRYGDARPKSREHGQGALYWDRSKSLWRAVIDVGYDPDTGRRLQVARTAKTKDAAMKKLNQILRERDSLGRVLNRSTRVSDVATLWLDDAAKRTKPKTLAGYRSNIRSKIIPAIGSRIVSDLTPADVRRLHTAVRRAGAGEASVASAHRTLVTLLEFARGERIIIENVAMLTPPRRASAPKARGALSRDQARLLLSQRDARWTMGLLTGLRSGEALALRWDDIDFDQRVAHVSWSLTDASFTHGCGETCGNTRGGNCPQRKIEISDELEWTQLTGRRVLVRPKNNTTREIPLTTPMVEELAALRERDTRNPFSLVWHRPDGVPRTNTDDNEHLRETLQRAGIDAPAATTHWLRHSYVTLSEHAGIPWAAYSGVSGHSSPEASDPYRHVLTDEGRSAVEMLSRWLGSSPGD